jgi:rRNA-processing protein FCF1
MKKIIFDTNFLLVPIQLRIDIYDKLTAEFFTTSRCIEELEIMARKKTRAGLQARAAMILAKAKDVQVLKTEGKTDESLISTAKEGGYMVATNDKGLLKKLKEADIRTIRIRQKKLLFEE